MSRCTRRPLAALALGTLILGVASPSQAVTVVLDGAAGAVYDSIGDGWFFAGGPAIPPDGVGDLGGNALAVVNQAGVVEMRALSEFPLAALAGYDAGDVTSATLTVTIDDVLTTLGPGTTFDGTAADPIAVYSYTGANGAITTADFAPPGLASLGLIAPGVVTDASLGVSGALAFEIDVTASVKAFVTAAATHYGVLLGTLDSATGTSVDDVSPPGVAGGSLPFLTIEITPQVPPTYTGDELKCQTGLAKAASGFAAAKQKALSSCLDAILKTVAKGGAATEVEGKCRKSIDEADAASKLAKAKVKATAAIAKACGGLTPADIDSPCDPMAATIAATATCVVDATEAQVEAMIETRYASACTLLEAIGLDAAFPGVCAP